MERAADWLFSRDGVIPDEEEQAAQPDAQAGAAKEIDGPGQYEMLGFIHHTGKSVDSGHYVCFLLRGTTWYKFNDGKVSVADAPPLDSGYAYLYRRKGQAIIE